MNKKKYTVEEFCKEYNKTEIKETKNAIVNKIMNNHYVPYELKVAICEKIIESSYYIKEEINGFFTKRIHVNSPSEYMLYCLLLVKEYTNIEVNLDEALDEFNQLNKCGALDTIYKNISDKEKKEFDVILDMTKNDFIKNEYETHAYISNQITRFGQLCGNIMEPLLKKIGDSVNNLDENAIEKLLNVFKNN